MGIENFMTFIFTALIFIMTPGIDTAFVLNKSIGQGRKSGIYAVLGLNSGVLIHTFFAALGLSVLISQSAYGFTILKYIGAIYLIYLGLMSLKVKKETSTKTPKKPNKLISKSDFWSGFLTNSLNPKVALFFLAFFPQFISPNEIKNPIPFVILGITYALIGVVWYLSLTLSINFFSRKFKGNPKSGIWLNKFSGLVFILMGIKIAMT